MARIKVKMNKLDTTLNKAFKEFIISKTAAGIKEETLKSYNRHFVSVRKYPDLDMVSIGPTLRGVHSPDEKLEIKTVQMCWDLLIEFFRLLK